MNPSSSRRARRAPRSRRSTMASHRSHRRPRTRSYQTQDNRSADRVIQQLHKRASSNQVYIKELHDACEREIGRATSYATHGSNKRARLRQLLIAMTGGNADATLFVDAESGQLQSPEATYAMVLQLGRAYRLETTPLWAFYRQLARSVQWLTTRITGTVLMSWGLIELACMAWLAYNFSTVLLAPTLDAKAKLVTTFVESLASSTANIASKFTAGATVLAVLRNASLAQGQFGDNSITRAIHNLIIGYNTFRIGRLEEVLLTDGVSDATRAQMQRVVRDHEALDLMVQERLYRNQSFRTDVFAQLLREYRKLHTGRFSGLYRRVFGATRHMKLLDLFDAHQHDDRTSGHIRTFRKEMIALMGGRFKGYHVCKSSGDARSSVQNIIAAFIYHDFRQWKAFHDTTLAKTDRVLFPGVAPKGSVKAAERYAKGNVKRYRLAGKTSKRGGTRYSSRYDKSRKYTARR